MPNNLELHNLRRAKKKKVPEKKKFTKEPKKRDDILQKRPIIWARGGAPRRSCRHQGRSK